jgi:hypothetical protein
MVLFYSLPAWDTGLAEATSDPGMRALPVSAPGRMATYQPQGVKGIVPGRG